MSVATDYDHLLRAVLETPEDDEVRLVLADWLEENGDVERAEFIRAQVGLANWKGQDEEHCPECGLHWKWRVGVGWNEWLDCKNDHRWCSIRHREWTRREQELLHGLERSKRRFNVCEWTGWPVSGRMWGSNGEVEYVPTSQPDGTRLLATFRRGFIESIRLPTAEFLHPDVTRQIFSLHPITHVTLTDAIQSRSYGGGDDRWAVWKHMLGPIWDILFVNATGYYPDTDSCTFAERDTREEFEPFLSRAAVVWGRSLAGLPPIRWEKIPSH